MDDRLLYFLLGTNGSYVKREHPRSVYLVNSRENIRQVAHIQHIPGVGCDVAFERSNA